MKKVQRYLSEKIGLKGLLVMSCPATRLAFIYISLDAGGLSRWGNREATTEHLPFCSVGTKHYGHSKNT